MTGKKSDSFFHCAPSERAVFEAGIKLEGLFHQFTGFPVSMGSAESLEKEIEKALRSQPFVRAIHVEIDREILEERCRGGRGVEKKAWGKVRGKRACVCTVGSQLKRLSTPRRRIDDWIY